MMSWLDIALAELEEDAQPEELECVGARFNAAW